MSLAAPQGHTCAPGHALEKADRNRELEALNSHSKCCQTAREGTKGMEGREEREKGEGEGVRRGGHYITAIDRKAKWEWFF